ncbi:MAG: hypothetical protein DRJ42_11325 [Deltaproteobacteria bacterium]|nr:MAG: hypothetical protein DRJ42_11325 [Deltaproteobacteria bacterium]
MGRRLIGLALAATLLSSLAGSACGGTEDEHAYGRSTAHRGPSPVDLEVRTTDGAYITLAELRGRPTILYLFATFDGVSQAAVTPLSRFVRHHPEVQVLAIAAQPNPGPFTEAWTAALAPPFVVAWDPEDQVTLGTTDLGSIEAVPTYVFLDARGIEVERYVGFASQNQLEGITRRVFE